MRLIGIDTPELAHFGDPEECGAARATSAIERFIGRKVRLRRDVTQDARDRYDRLLRYVDRPGTARTSADFADRPRPRGRIRLRDPFTRLASYERAADAAQGGRTWALVRPAAETSTARSSAYSRPRSRGGGVCASSPNPGARILDIQRLRLNGSVGLLGSRRGIGRSLTVRTEGGSCRSDRARPRVGCSRGGRRRNKSGVAC